MTARVLIVDDLVPNLKLLKAQLTGQYFTVLTATSGIEALELLRQEHPDLVLRDVIMPGMTGFEVCAASKADAETCDIPIVLITALTDVADKLTGFDCGADEFFSKPVDHDVLLARIRNLAREKLLLDELRLRSRAMRRLGAATHLDANGTTPSNGRVFVVDTDLQALNALGQSLKMFEFGSTGTHESALACAVSGEWDIGMINLRLGEPDGLRLCAAIRAHPLGRHRPLIAFGPSQDIARTARAFDLGMNDFISSPMEHRELIARIRLQLKKKSEFDTLDRNLGNAVTLAITDQLTGLPNRHCLSAYFTELAEHLARLREPLSFVVIDIDHFKSINDVFGHSAGDEVLAQIGERIRAVVREADFTCRFGGEEFLVGFRRVDEAQVVKLAERLRAAIENEPVTLKKPPRRIPVTVSIGIAHLCEKSETVDDLFRRADEALYFAKRSGRNCVRAHAG